MLDLGALRTFLRVASLGGIGAAARDLKVTQPAVSQRVRGLEEGLGRKLFGRAGRGLVLTEDGRRLFEACRRAFDVLEAAEAALQRREAEVVGSVRIAALSELAKVHVLPKTLEFRRRHPGVEFDLLYRLPFEMLGSLLRHEVDFALTNEPYRRPQIEVVPLFKERIVCVGPGPAKRLSAKELERLPWLAYGAEDPVWSEFEHLCSRKGIRLPRPTFRVADVESVLRLAAAGAGFALAPEHAVRMRELRGLAVHPLPVAAFQKTIYACRLRTVPMGRAAQAFWDEWVGGFRRKR